MPWGFQGCKRVQGLWGFRISVVSGVWGLGKLVLQWLGYEALGLALGTVGLRASRCWLFFLRVSGLG